MIKQVSFAFVFLLVLASHSQGHFESNAIIKEKITYHGFPEKGFGKEVFSLLGSENNVDVRKISLDAKARMLIRVSRDLDHKLTAKISITGVSLNGNIAMRDFNVDSLLWPSGFTAKLTVYNGKHKHCNVQVSGSASGKLVKIDLSDYLPSNIGDVKAVISDLKFNYNETKLLQLQELAETIGYYYSYGKLLDGLVKKHAHNAVSNNQGIGEIFIGKIEIDRATYYINGHDFITRLNLKNYDPIGFLKLTKKFQRLSKRAATLFNQQITGNGTDVFDPLGFCNLYCGLSSSCLEEAKLLQPADASGFEEVAKVDLTESTKENLGSITEFYNRDASTKPVNVNQCIFNKFVVMADASMADDNFTDALLLLNNSLAIHNWFGTVITQKYNSSSTRALDGVASSYLRVGKVALNARNLEFATLYFNKADDVFELNRNLMVDTDHNDTAFGDYLRLQYEIAMQYIGIEQYSTALTRLATAKNICSKLNSPTICKLVDSAMCLSRSGIFVRMLDNLEETIEVGQYPDAHRQLMSAALYSSNGNCFFKKGNNRFGELSYSLFLEFLQRGEILIDAEQSEMALNNLLNAKSIQQYLHGDSIELDRLIQTAAEPEIIELIDEAKFHTWANRMDEAENLHGEAVELNAKYFSNRNGKINGALEQLNDQMKSRKCITCGIKYSDAIKKVRIAIKNKQFNRLAGLLNEAQSYVDTYPECNIQNNEILELESKHKPVLDFYQQYDDVTKKLFERGYGEVIEQYIMLTDFYNYNGIFHYDIYFPNLKTFIVNQQLPSLTMATAGYYIENNDPETGLMYVKIFRDQRGDPKIIKHIVADIAKNLALRPDEQKIPVKEALHQYTSGNSWFNNFKVVYLKNRLLNQNHLF